MRGLSLKCLVDDYENVILFFYYYIRINVIIFSNAIEK